MGKNISKNISKNLNGKYVLGMSTMRQKLIDDANNLQLAQLKLLQKE